MTSIRSVLAGLGDVEYDEALHVYRVGDETWPSVTQILSPLNDFDDIPPKVLEKARLRGSAVDTLVNEVSEGKPVTLDAFDPNHDYVRQWILFLQTSRATVLEVQPVICNRTLRYCGRFDILLSLNDKVTLVDVKATAIFPRTTGPQTAAYAAGYLGPHKIQRRLGVLLRPKGYELFPLDESSDMNIFVSCLNIWRFKHGTKH